MLRLILNITVLIIYSFPAFLLGQSITVNYSGGDIPTSYPNRDISCNGPSNQLTISLPDPGVYTITGIDVSYDFEAVFPGWISDQRSVIYFVNNNVFSPEYYEPIDNAGIQSYQITNDPLINGVYIGPIDLTFELRVWRVYDNDTGSCSGQLNKVKNNTWSVTVHYNYTYSPPSLADIYKGENGDGYDRSAQMNLNPYIPPGLANIFTGGAGDGYHHSIQLNLNPYIPPGLANIFTGGAGDGYHHSIQLNLNPYIPTGLANIFYGGSGDGYETSLKRFLNPNCADGIFYWTGQIDNNWFNPGNWDCSTLPNTNSHVIINRNLINYPVVNNHVEISKLTMHYLTTLNIINNAIFIINVNL